MQGFGDEYVINNLVKYPQDTNKVRYEKGALSVNAGNQFFKKNSSAKVLIIT